MINYNSPVPVVDATKLSKQEFMEHYHKPQKPVILRGLWKQYPAYEKWTMEFFKNAMGDITVDLFSTTKADPSATIKVPHARMKFSEYLNLIEREPTDLRLFLFPVFKYKPELLKDFGYPDITGGYIKLPFMFFGPKNAITRIHQDIDMSNVFLTQFSGRKRVVLFSPDQSRLLYRLPFNVHTTVDIDHPDYEKYPGLKYVTGSTAILEFGDTLFMPSGYWHHIEYLEAGFGLSVRTVAPTLMLKLKGAYNLSIQRKLDDIMRKMFNKKWFAYKTALAQKRANREIQKMNSGNNGNHRHNPAYN